MSWIKDIVDYIKDLTKEDITSEIRERITNPLFIALIFGWVIINWELVFILFSSHNDFSLNSKIGKIRTYIEADGTEWWVFKSKLFVKPIQYALAAIVIISLLKLVTLFITTLVNKWLKPLVYKLADQNKLVPKDDLDDIKEQFHRLREKYNKIYDEKSATSDENEDLQKEVETKTSDERKAKRLHEVVVNQLNNVILKLKTFKNQPPPKAHSAIDDDYYEDVFDLSNYDYEVSVAPTTHINHWRYGVKFSKTQNFPDKTERHQSGFPVVHLEKNENDGTLGVSFYDEKKENIRYATRITVYRKQKVSIRVIRTNNDTSVMVVDKNHKHILKEWQNVGNYPYCKVFAWADSKNDFEIDTQIKIIPK